MKAVVSWVLSPFNDEQQKLMDAAFDTSVKFINDLLRGRMPNI
jgi:PTH1 family peptidyl-tRNA hydrolase